jgi:crotonobetainyl-CoA:carnitine CoA-transferase CaiB-like acyl-CoA transferase
MNQPFQGLKVVELATVLAGPSVGMFLAELDAEVIKIEPLSGDVTRHWRTAAEKADGPSAYFSSINFGKSHRLRDLKNPDHLAETNQLIREADIFLHNFKAGDDVRYGLDFETLNATNPRLIIGSIYGFESDKNRVAYDVVLQAESGFMYLNGFSPTQNNLKMPVALIDVLAAHQLKEGLLLALLQREKTGKGCAVSVSLEKAALSALANQASNYLMTGASPEAMGSLHPNIAPYGETFVCADGKKLLLAVGSDAQFSKLCDALGEANLAKDLRFATNAERVKHREALQNELAQSIGQHNRDTLLEKLNALHIPAAAVKSIPEVFENPVAQNMVRTETVDGHETKRLSSIAFRLH